MEPFEIRPLAPYDAQAAFGFLARCREEPVDVVDGPTLRRLLLIGDTALEANVRSIGDVDHPCLAIDLRGDDADTVTATALEQIRRLLNLDADPAPFVEACERHPVLRAVAEERRGVRPVGTPTVFEAIVWAITGQHVALGVACMLKGRLVRLYGRQEGGLRAFPAPAVLAAADPDLLGQNGFTRAKHRAIIGVAAAVVDGSFDVEDLRAVGREAAFARLVAFPGIGPWTAEYVLARGLGHPDGFPAGDVGLRRAVERLLGVARASQADVEALAEPFTGWRAWLTFLLWSLL